VMTRRAFDMREHPEAHHCRLCLERRVAYVLVEHSSDAHEF
jgi:hypothetical protein